MRLFTVAFLGGVSSIAFFQSMPSMWFIICVLGGGFFGTLILPRRYAVFIFGLCLGLSWVLVFAQYRLNRLLPRTLEGKTLIIRGDIVSLPQVSHTHTNFLFEVDHLGGMKHILVKLSGYGLSSQFNAGDQWQLMVRLRRPRGLMNPGGQNRAQWFFTRGISASGYIVYECHNQKLKSKKYQHLILKLRSWIRYHINTRFSTDPLRHCLSALVIGDRSSVTPHQWQTLKKTGTLHIMSIAGLHIGLASSSVFFLTRWLWCRIPLFALVVSAPQIAAFLSLMAALGYGVLTGFTLPTQRAFIMLSVILMGVMMKRYILAWYSISMAVLIVLFINPLSVLERGFWMSFSCVAMIVYGLQGRYRKSGQWWRWSRVQSVLTLGLLPLVLWFFSEFSCIAPIANLLIIPWFGFVILPLCLGGVLLMCCHLTVGDHILSVALLQFKWFWRSLEYLAHLPWPMLHYSFYSPWCLMFCMMAVLVLLMPRGCPGRYLAVFFLLPLLTITHEVPQFSSAWLTVLDVGQGLAAVVQTQHHVLVFDTGPRWSTTSDAGEEALLPYCRYFGIKVIDRMIVSHGDLDHIGGSQSLLKNIAVKEILSSVPQKFLGQNAWHCHRGQRWIWDGVRFEMLSPETGQYDLDNNSSCVLKITTVQGQRILLTGDIELEAERELVRSRYALLKSDILVAPHHGSKSSSSVSFVHAVQPKIVLFSVGYRNRFHFPHKKVVRRYQMQGTIQYDTAHGGAIQFRLDHLHHPFLPHLYRLENHPLWETG